MRLHGKVAIITGGGRGMGRSGAELFAREGARVAVVDVRPEAAEEAAAAARAAGDAARAYPCDVTDPEAVAAMVAAVQADLGRVDILWSNVGGAAWAPGGGKVRPGGSLLETSLEEWDWMLRLNLTSAWLCCRAVIPVMVAQGGGAIVLTSSSAGLLGNTPRAHAYAVAKGGVIAMGKVIASTWGRRGVRCNVVVPGLTDSYRGPALEAWAADVTALGRIGTVEEVARVAAFLASDDAAFVSGETLLVDGGAAVWRGEGPPIGGGAPPAVAP